MCYYFRYKDTIFFEISALNKQNILYIVDNQLLNILYQIFHKLGIAPKFLHYDTN